MSDELKAFKLAMRAHHPNATPAEESIAWKLWQSAWSECKRASACDFCGKGTPVLCSECQDDADMDGS